MDMKNLVPGKEYTFEPRGDAEQSLRELSGSIFTLERQGVLFPDMAMGLIHGLGRAVFPDELSELEPKNS